MLGQQVNRKPFEQIQQDEVERDYERGYVVWLGRRRIHIGVLIAIAFLIPFLDAGILRMRYPDLSAAPPPFGTVQSYSNEYGRREYLFYAPANLDQGTAAPLLVFLHGCTQTPQLLEAASGMKNVADEQGFMIVYPQQDFNSSPHRCWNWYAKEHQHRDTGEPSLIVGIVNQIKQEHNVDASRIYIAGISSGGAMTSIIANCYPDVFAAAAIHSGMAYEASTNIPEAIFAPLSGSKTPPVQAGFDAYQCAGEARRPSPIMVIHGTVDNVVLKINGDNTIEQFAQMNDLADDGTDNDSVVAKPTSSQTHQVPDGYTYTVNDYEYGGKLLMQQYVIDGMNHLWSGGTGIFPLSDPKAPDASRFIWEFFHNHTLS
jgi:poly(hydroxyalkanoate) depolymerase family esterase